MRSTPRQLRSIFLRTGLSLLLGGLALLGPLASEPQVVLADRLERIEGAEKLMPESAKSELNRVLAGPEFQPRHTHQRWKFDLQGMLITTWEHFARWVKDHLGELSINLPRPTFLQPVADVFLFLGGALLSILEFFAKNWWIFVVLALSYFAARYLWRRRPRIEANLDRALEQLTRAPELLTWEKLQELMKTGQLEQVLIQLRVWFRGLSKQEFQIPLSATDREALARIPKTQSERECFLRIVRVFERFAFASEAPQGIEVQQILEQAEPHFRSGRIAKGGA